MREGRRGPVSRFTRSITTVVVAALTVPLGSLAASSLLILAGWFLFLQPAPVQAEFAIHSYEITPDHGTVMLWQDAASQATILWISDLDDPAPAMETEP